MTGRYLFSLQLFIVGFLIHLNTSVFALESTGEGSNQRQALNAALRQAVEMSMGTEIETNTLVENFQVIRQQILSHTKGFVKSYKILNQSNKNGITRITIDANVNDGSIKDSTKALSTLMKMAAHPRVLVAPLDEGFDSISSLSDEFTLLTESVESTLREDFRFDVLDSETVRRNDKNQYRFTDRKNNLKRAKRAKAEFLIFVEIIKGRDFPFTLKLESVDVASHRSLAKEEINFSMADWTRDEKNNRLAVINEAKDHIYGPSAQVAVALVENLRKEVYGDGQRFELSFSRFDEENHQIP